MEEELHYVKPASDPKRGIFFWQHQIDGVWQQFSTHKTNLTPLYCWLCNQYCAVPCEVCRLT